MSREMTMKLNQILYQRSKNWIENRPNTGILRLLEKKPSKEEDMEKHSFDKYLRGHIKTSNKTINIRGLFRVPDVSGGERLMIDAEEKEEQKEQVPVRDIDVLPPEHEPLIPHSLVINDHPFRRPTHVEVMQDFPSETDYKTIGTTKCKTHATKTKTNVTSAEMMGMIMDLENKKDVPENVRDEKIWELMENFNMKMEFKMDKTPLSFNDYVNYIKDNPSKTIAVLDHKTGGFLF